MNGTVDPKTTTEAAEAVEREGGSRPGGATAPATEAAQAAKPAAATEASQPEKPDADGVVERYPGAIRKGSLLWRVLHLKHFPVSVRKFVERSVSPQFIELDFFTVFWLFFFASILGLALETLYHAVVFGGYESRAGLVWGPFSPIYGFGAAILTILLNRLYYTHNLVIFLVSMVVGATIEYVTSWGMQTFWGAVSWDYTGTFGSIDGRTNFFFGFMWGLLGLFWVRAALPFIKKVFGKIDKRNLVLRAITSLTAIFMVVNCDVTCLAIYRESERMEGVPAHNAVDRWLDHEFPTSWMKERFQNMTVDPHDKK